MSNKPTKPWIELDVEEGEDYIVGNREGLELLHNTIGEAIQNGQASMDNGYINGVKCVEDGYSTMEPHKNTLGSYIAFGLIAIAFLGTVFLVWLEKTNQ
jgi:hypothetical protein